MQNCKTKREVWGDIYSSMIWQKVIANNIILIFKML